MRSASTIFLIELLLFPFLFLPFWAVKYSAPHTKNTRPAMRVSFVWGERWFMTTRRLCRHRVECLLSKEMTSLLSFTQIDAD
jgi:hypothetical protein